MKSYFIHALFFLVAVGSGLTIAYVLSGNMHDRADARLEYLWDAERDTAEIIANIHLANIQTAQTGDYERLLSLNCIFLKSNLPRLQPERHKEPARRQRATTQLERIQTTVQDLEEQGLCDWPE